MKACERCQGTGSVLKADYTKFIDCPACGGWNADALEGDTRG